MSDINELLFRNVFVIFLACFLIGSNCIVCMWAAGNTSFMSVQIQNLVDDTVRWDIGSEIPIESQMLFLEATQQEKTLHCMMRFLPLLLQKTPTFSCCLYWKE